MARYSSDEGMIVDKTHPVPVTYTLSAVNDKTGKETIIAAGCNLGEIEYGFNEVKRQNNQALLGDYLELREWVGGRCIRYLSYIHPAAVYAAILSQELDKRYSSYSKGN